MDASPNKEVIEGTRYFIKIVELGSYSAVKNNCGVELNTIKAKIEVLEKYLDIKLIQNIQNKISPTANGFKYYHSCNEVVKDLEMTISGIKHNGFNERATLRILGSPIFIQSVIDLVIPKLEESKPTNNSYTLNDYLLDNMYGAEYKLDMYDVVHIYTKNLNHISLDDWIVCSTMDSMDIQAPVYASDELILEHDLHNNPTKIQEMPLIFNKYDYTYRVVNFKHKGELYKFKFENVKYIVDNQIHKAKLLQKSLGIGFMPKVHHSALSALNKGISAIDGVSAEFHIEPQLVLINKNSKHLKVLLSTIRETIALNFTDDVPK